MDDLGTQGNYTYTVAADLSQFGLEGFGKNGDSVIFVGTPGL